MAKRRGLPQEVKDQRARLAASKQTKVYKDMMQTVSERLEQIRKDGNNHRYRSR